MFNSAARKGGRIAARFQSFSRPGSKGSRKPGRNWFMSTQKRETRTALAIERPRRANGTPWQRAICMEYAPAAGTRVPARDAIGFRAAASGRTAPFMSMVMWAWAWLATKFLHKEQPSRQSVQPETSVELPGAAPPRRPSQAAVRGTPECPRSSLPPMPLLSGFASSLLTLPHAPAARTSEHLAERHDGKRDLYFLHAA